MADAAMNLFGFLFYFGLPVAWAAFAIRIDEHPPARIWITTAGVAVAVATLGFAAHKAGFMGSEGSGMTPITQGLVIPLLVTSVVRLAYRLPKWARFGLGSAVGLAVVLPLVVISHYGLSGIVPKYFGCCPL